MLLIVFPGIQETRSLNVRLSKPLIRLLFPKFEDDEKEIMNYHYSGITSFEDLRLERATADFEGAN
ncbi:MAG: hypothetical protein MZV63_42945 [Marinilabiliales bacterium]|nr:hypothetical protein [Marinilabiliales bacterium]